jgi:three-Cys-motif partner protein
VLVPIPFKFDEVGIWSELKLEIVEKYGSAYTAAFANQPSLRKFYIDAFSGAGVHISKRSGGQIDGSPARALKNVTVFRRLLFHRYGRTENGASEQAMCRPQ